MTRRSSWHCVLVWTFITYIQVKEESFKSRKKALSQGRELKVKEENLKARKRASSQGRKLQVRRFKSRKRASSQER